MQNRKPQFHDVSLQNVYIKKFKVQFITTKTKNPQHSSKLLNRGGAKCPGKIGLISTRIHAHRYENDVNCL